MATTGPPPFHVVIVGGSISGLTLAHCFTHLKVPYTLLESHSSLAPQVGASIGIFPNGARILDQLGVFDDIERMVVPGAEGVHWRADGSLNFVSDFPRLYQLRFGYPMSFLDRQMVLEVLWQRLPESAKANVHPGERVVRVEHTDVGVRVHTKTGKVFPGALVVGADGVHSVVRTEMHRTADLLSPGLIPASDRKMSATYACIYGISTATPGMHQGTADFVFDDLASYLGVTGAGGRVFWFLFKKLPATVWTPNIPRYTAADADALAAQYAAFPIGPHVTFGALWRNRVTGVMAPLEEKVFAVWHFARFVGVGDSMHKMTPTLGQGGNSAIESAAVLANELHTLLKTTPNPDMTQLNATLASYQQNRHARATEIVALTAWLTRMHARDGLANRVFGTHVAPRGGDIPANLTSDLIRAGARIDFLPLPARSTRGWMAFSEAPEPSPWRRALLAGVFPALLYILPSTVGGAVDAPLYLLWLAEALRRGHRMSPANLAPLLWSHPAAHAAFYALHYVFNPYTKVAALDQRGIHSSYAATLPLAVGMAALDTALWPAEAKVPHAPFAVSGVVLAWCYAAAVRWWWARGTGKEGKVEAVEEKLAAPNADLPHLRRAYILAFVASCYFHLSSLSHLTQLSSLSSLSLSSIPTPSTAAVLAAAWATLTVLDLKTARRTDASWTSLILGAVVLLVLGGPAGLAVGAWSWREGVLAGLRRGVLGDDGAWEADDLEVTQRGDRKNDDFGRDREKGRRERGWSIGSGGSAYGRRRALTG